MTLASTGQWVPDLPDFLFCDGNAYGTGLHYIDCSIAVQMLPEGDNPLLFTEGDVSGRAVKSPFSITFSQ